MKYIDFPLLFDTEPAKLALLSTFNFDPDYFERQLLRSKALAKARRIAIFMDAGQWQQLRLQDIPARWLNRRYLLVPVHQSSGVFHPKLHLTISDESWQVFCGSSNLTRAGCSHNLELLNSTKSEFDENGTEKHPIIARSAFHFFELVADKAMGEAGTLVKSWIREEKIARRWFADLPSSATSGEPCSLVHTLDGSLWDRLVALTKDSPPNRMLIISPFYDLDAEMFKRVRATWPKCRLEIIAQQHTSNLPVAAIKSARIPLELREVSCRPRRLHAKLLVWENEFGGGCFVGSANFTSAAWDARNVEACFFVPSPGEMITRLFDSQLSTHIVQVADFVAGTEREPESVVPDSESTMLSLRSATLTKTSRLRIQYRCAEKLAASALALSVRAGGEHRPRAAVPIPVAEESQHVIDLEPHVLADVHGAIVVSLVAKLPHGEQESAPLWLIQEDRLTFAPSDSDSAHSQSAVVENGFGIPEYLEELGRREGAQAIIEYLNRLNIHFHDGSKGFAPNRRFRVRQNDPFHPDILPEWWRATAFPQDDLQKAILLFVRRHEDRQLKKHATRGNINGMENFLDVLVAIVRLMYVYRIRGIVRTDQLVYHIGRCLEIATVGIHKDFDSSQGYLVTLSKNLSGNKRMLQDVANELNFSGYLDAVLLIAQMAETASGRPNPSSGGNDIGVYKVRPSTEPDRYVTLTRDGGQWKTYHDGVSGQIRRCLPELVAKLSSGMKAAGIRRPTADMTTAALKSFEMLTEDELASYRAKLPQD